MPKLLNYSNFIQTVIALGLITNALLYFSPQAQAEIAGKNWMELKSDYDFKKAVEKIVERCDVENGTEIDC